nr:hypothetical protein Iba_chr06aCG10660 [Ipomoea batatas]
MDATEGRGNSKRREERGSNKPLKAGFILDYLEPPAKYTNTRIRVFTIHGLYGWQGGGEILNSVPPCLKLLQVQTGFTKISRSAGSSIDPGIQPPSLQQSSTPASNPPLPPIVA